jgi:hypothetical protein
MALIPPVFLDCVVAIGLEHKESEAVWVASGFLYGDSIGKAQDGRPGYQVYLVTNRHVLEGNAQIHLRFNPVEDQAARQYIIDILDSDGKPKWMAHQNHGIDLAIVPVNAQRLQAEGIRFSCFYSDRDCANTRKMTELGITEGDFVYVLGFPMGLIGGKRNFVIARGGIIARVRDTLAHFSDEFLIDTFIFPGNSGGPVISKPELLSIRGTKSQSAAYLIGVVTGYIPYKEVAISQQTREPRVIFEENSGLAAVHPIDSVEGILERSGQQAV